MAAYTIAVQAAHVSYVPYVSLSLLAALLTTMSNTAVCTVMFRVSTKATTTLLM
jgi:hypothetical protein